MDRTDMYKVEVKKTPDNKTVNFAITAPKGRELDDGLVICLLLDLVKEGLSRSLGVTSSQMREVYDGQT